MNNQKIADAKPIITAVAFILIFAALLLFALSSLGRAEGGAKVAPGAPDSLVSAGAPRSQLELKRMFEGIGLTYTEDGRTVYEPISREYRAALEERIAAGESPALSVEEILFIVSDSAAAYENFDIIRFKNADGETEEEIYPKELRQSGDAPYARAALERIRNVSELIELRVRKMSAGGAFNESEDGSVSYTPRGVEREKGGTSASTEFLFGGAAGYTESVVFMPGNGTKVVLYPSSEEAALCRTKVILHTDIEASNDERALLSSVGADPERCRNITPEYFYGRTELRLFVLGGEVVLTDTEKGKALLLLENNERLSSVAFAEDGLYYTTQTASGSSVYKYSSGEVETLFVSDSQLAVSEPLEGEYISVQVYKAERRENESFVTVLECVGDHLAEYSAE